MIALRDPSHHGRLPIDRCSVASPHLVERYGSPRHRLDRDTFPVARHRPDRRPDPQRKGGRDLFLTDFDENPHRLQHWRHAARRPRDRLWSRGFAAGDRGNLGGHGQGARRDARRPGDQDGVPLRRARRARRLVRLAGHQCDEPGRTPHAGAGRPSHDVAAFRPWRRAQRAVRR